jgi:ketosteroid isomerase-like protein
MSQENVEKVKASLDAFTDRDKDAWSSLCDPEVEAVPVGDWPEKQIRGRKAVWDFLLASDEPWEPGPYEILEAIDGGDVVAAHLQRDLRGKSSGVAVEYDYWALFTFRDAKVHRVEWFHARGEALEAAGLSE